MYIRDPRSLLTLAAAAAVLAASGGLRAQEKPAVPPPAAEAPAAPTQDDPVIAKVGEQELHTSDLIAELNRQIPLTYFHAKVPENQMLGFRRKAFDQLVERSLVHQDALARKIEVTDEEIQAEFRKALRSSEELQKVSEQQLDKEAAKLLPQFRPLVVRRLLIEKNEARFRSSVPKPDDASMKAVYEQMLKDSPESMQTPKEAHLLHIYIAIDPAGGEKAAKEKQKKVDDLKQQLAAGKSFDEIAKALSEDESAKNGGDLGFVKAGFFRSSEIERVAFELKAGDVSDVFRSLYGFHVLKCLEVKPRRPLTIEETRPMLEQWFVTEHTQRRRAVWLQELRGRYKVEILSEEFTAPPPEVKVPGGKAPMHGGAHAPAAGGEKK